MTNVLRERFKVLSIEDRLRLMDLYEPATKVVGKYGLTIQEATGRGRTAPQAGARHDLWIFLHASGGYSGSFIAELFGCHATTVNEVLKKWRREQGEAA